MWLPKTCAFEVRIVRLAERALLLACILAHRRLTATTRPAPRSCTRQPSVGQIDAGCIMSRFCSCYARRWCVRVRPGFALAQMATTGAPCVQWTPRSSHPPSCTSLTLRLSAWPSRCAPPLRASRAGSRHFWQGVLPLFANSQHLLAAAARRRRWRHALVCAFVKHVGDWCDGVTVVAASAGRAVVPASAGLNLAGCLLRSHAQNAGGRAPTGSN